MEVNKNIILVVDDTEQNLSVLGNILMETGYEVIPASSGKEAFESISEMLPDLILLDIMMPEMDGYEVCKILKSDEITKEIPVIFLTAKIETEDVIKAFNLGAVDYVTKPFRKEELLARVKTHLELRRSLKAEQDLVKMKDKLFSIIGHDLRGPIGTFMMMLETVTDEENKYTVEKIMEYLHKMKDVAKSIYQLLDNLLCWARSQRKLVEYHPFDLFLHNIVEQCCKVLNESATKKSITLYNEISPGTVVFCDENTITTVIRNLISNSLKFTTEGGNITIKENKNVKFVEVAVKDSGVGMSGDSLKKLFRQDQIFTKFGTNGEKGTGLGLLLCKDFVEGNGGNIRVESEIGKGTTFYFTLPVLK
jgi:two-component system, sensor histidine kinase and response regulator